jgi:hypothetical protein
MDGPRYGAYDGAYWGVEDALREENRKLAAEVLRQRAELANVRAAALAYLAETDGRAMTFREHVARVELARLVGGTEVGS